MATFMLTKPDGTPMPVSFFGLVDSGADNSLFPISVMTNLGIDQSDCDEHQNIGSSGIGIRYCWKRGKLAADFYGVTVDLCVEFSDTPFILLGRSDFFARFSVAFDQKNLRFTLEEY